MSADRGKPVHLTNGERKLVIKACETAFESWTALKDDPDKETANVASLRCKQYMRIIRECIQADPEPKPQ